MLCCTHCCLPLSPHGLQGIKKVFWKGDIFLGAKGKIKQGVQMRFLSRLGSEFRLESETYYVISGRRCMNHTSSQCDLCAIYVWYRASTVCHSAGWKSIYEWFKIMPSVVFYSICNIMSVPIALQRNLSGSSRTWISLTQLLHFRSGLVFWAGLNAEVSGQLGIQEVDVAVSWFIRRETPSSPSPHGLCTSGSRCALNTECKSDPQSWPMAVMTEWKIGECACQRSVPPLSSFTDSAGFWFLSVCQLKQPFTHLFIWLPHLLYCTELS